MSSVAPIPVYPPWLSRGPALFVLEPLLFRPSFDHDSSFAGVGELEVYAKTGTWGPIYADAGIVRHPDGRQLVVAVFIEGKPRYRGDFIADVTHRAVERLLP